MEQMIFWDQLDDNPFYNDDLYAPSVVESSLLFNPN
jgi:hypothetical protein